MRASYIETWGVFCGFIRPFMDGYLVMPAGSGYITFDWGYGGAHAMLDRADREVNGS